MKKFNLQKYIRKYHLDGKPPPGYVTVERASELLGCSANTLYGRIAGKKIPFIRRGWRIYLSRHKLKVHIKNSEVRRLYDTRIHHETQRRKALTDNQLRYREELLNGGRIEKMYIDLL